MLLSRLRRYFSSKSSSSTAYHRLPTLISRSDYDRPKPVLLHPLPIVKEDFQPSIGDGDFDRQQASPPRSVTITDGGSENEEKTSAMYRIESELQLWAIGDGDSDWQQASPPRSVTIENELRAMNEEAPTHCSFGPIGDGDSNRQQASPPRSGTIENELKAMNEEAPTHCSFGPIGDGDSDWKQASPPRSVRISDGGIENEVKTSAMYRIENELRAMNEEPPTHCSFGPIGADIFQWEGVVIGPACSCYEGGIFCLRIQFPSDYPLTPPSICFLTKIFHPNVEGDGSINIDILKENWSSALTIEKLLLSICSILSNPDLQGSMNEASSMYLNNWLNYKQIATEWTKLYAMEN